MYLILNRGDRIVAITPQISYVKTQSNGSTIITDVDSATAVYSSANDTFYRLRELTPGEELYRVLESATVPEGVPAGCLQYADGAVTINMAAMLAAKEKEIADACYAAITEGCTVDLTGGASGHFSLAETDQINLTAAATATAQGATGYPYHADGQLCRLFSAADIDSIAAAATAHKVYHTTYCNHLLTWARRADTAEAIAAITYGAKLPPDLAANMEGVLGNAKKS